MIEIQSIDRVIIAFSRVSHEELLEAIRACRDAGVAVDVVPRLFEFLDGIRRATPEAIADIILRASKNRSTRPLTVATSVPEPFAIRARREPLMMFGSVRSAGVIE